MKRKVSNKGVTLIEVLVASLLLSIAITPMLYYLAFSRDSIRESGYEANATYLLKDWFESVKNLPDLNAVCASSGNIGKLLTEKNAQLETIDGVVYKLHFDTAGVRFNGDDSPRLVQLTGTVKWEYKGKERSIAMSMRSKDVNYK